MKAKVVTPALSPAFADEAQKPTGRDLDRFLKGSSPAEALTHWLRATRPDAVLEWNYSAQSGWYLVARLKKRRLFYLLPRRERSELLVILGRKALASLEQTPQAGAVKRLLASAKVYPEGTLLTLPAGDFDPALAITLLQAKLAF